MGKKKKIDNTIKEMFKCIGKGILFIWVIIGVLVVGSTLSHWLIENHPKIFAILALTTIGAVLGFFGWAISIKNSND